MNTAKKKVPVNNEESYRPQKAMPEIIKMVSNEKDNHTPIGTIKPFEDILQIYYMPESRVIGKEVIVPQNENVVPDFWGKVIVSGDLDVIKGLPSIIEGATCGWTCDWVEETKSFSYLVSAICPKDTPVPVGFVYRDVPETLVAKGLFGEDIHKTCERMAKLGYFTDYERAGCGWNTELYLSQEDKSPDEEGFGWRWLVPCIFRRP